MAEQLFGVRIYVNLRSEITASDATLNLFHGQGGHLWQVWSASKVIYLCLMDLNGNLEIVQVTNVDGDDDQITVVRAQDNTTARAWPAGTLLTQKLVAVSLNVFDQGIQQSGDGNPHALVTADFTGQRYYDETNQRHFISMGGTNWKLLTGGLVGSEFFNEDGYIEEAVPTDEYLVPTSDIVLGNWSVAPLYDKINNGLAGPGANPDLIKIAAFVAGATCELHLSDPSAGVAAGVTMRLRVSSIIAPLLMGVQLFHGVTAWSVQKTIGAGGDFPWPANGSTTLEIPLTLTPLTDVQAADLRVKFEAIVTFARFLVWVHEFELEVLAA